MSNGHLTQIFFHKTDHDLLTPQTKIEWFLEKMTLKY